MESRVTAVRTIPAAHSRQPLAKSESSFGKDQLCADSPISPIFTTSAYDLEYDGNAKVSAYCISYRR